MSARPQMNLTPPEDLPSALAAEGDPMPGVCARRLLMVVALLVVFGLTMLYSTSYNVVGTKHFKFQLIGGKKRRAAISMAATIPIQNHRPAAIRR